MNPNLARLQSYPFEKLAALKEGVTPPELPPIAWSIGEPKQPAPDFVLQAMSQHLDRLASYPVTKGMPELRQACAHWLERRFRLPPQGVDPERQVLPVAGTREALFAIAQAVIDERRDPLVVTPNPFYQIYEGAALLAGAEPYFVNTTEDNGYLPDFDEVPEDVWERCQLLYLCNPGNPTGAVMDLTLLQEVIERADYYDFVIASDECYSEIYTDEDNAPPGLLQAAAQMGMDDYRRCLVFHSLSKRSNLPGLRSGFVAGDATILERFLKYRTYQGCALPVPAQYASIAAWEDEDHVHRNRLDYTEKFNAVLSILEPVLDVRQPDAGFYLWPHLPVDDEAFARGLFQEQAVTVLPGRYLSRQAHGINPGENHVRMALVGPLDECIEAAQRIRTYVETL